MPRHRTRLAKPTLPTRWILPATASLALLLAGCYAPSPVVHASLTITADGRYMLNGVNVPAAELSTAVAANAQRTSAVIVEIQASPQTDVAAIKLATEAIKAAHSRVAFAPLAMASP
jgi:biopolymer transport protein ExbD